MTEPISTASSISTLNSLLQGERSAVATYEQAQRHLDGEHASELEANRSCHAKRIDVLTRRILELGGDPTVKGGAWVGFTKVVEQAASLMGTSAVVAAMEQGEDIGLDNYKDAVLKVDTMSKTMIVDDLLPAQERTHWRMSGVKQMA